VIGPEDRESRAMSATSPPVKPRRRRGRLGRPYSDRTTDTEFSLRFALSNQVRRLIPPILTARDTRCPGFTTPDVPPVGEHTMTKHQPRHEVELYRENDTYVVVAQLPEADREAIDVDWTDGHLHVAAEISDEGRRRVVTRRLSFPKEIDPEGISAAYDEGILEVSLPIVGDERPRALKIDVE
jgi:HSP20 family protein